MAEVCLATLPSFSPIRRCNRFTTSSLFPTNLKWHCALPSDYSPTFSSYSHCVEGLQFLPSVHTLRNFPVKDLTNKIVMVRFDSSLLLASNSSSSILTIRYLLTSGAQVILVGDWGNKKIPNSQSQQSFAKRLSAILGRKVHVLQRFTFLNSSSDLGLADNMCNFKDEVANSLQFAERLAAGVDIFVNECFSSSHKILASNVGVTKFCYARLAGFQFEESLNSLKRAVEITKTPSAVIVGGTNLLDKEAALLAIVSISDAVAFVGMMSFQIMNASGIKVPPSLINPAACQAASNIVNLARKRNVSIIYPVDFWCASNEEERRCFSAEELSSKSLPIELGPRSLHKIKSILTKMKKITWISPAQFKCIQTNASLKLAEIVSECAADCEITVAGEIPCEAMKKTKCNMIPKAAVMWEHLKGRKLHGVLALDREYQFEVNWGSVFRDPSRPLAVDIGSGNGMFALAMAKNDNQLNFLGLEMNKRLVDRCLEEVKKSGSENCSFIAANATSMFRSIVSSYPGDLVLVSVQCPNPDFDEPENRWSMVQRSLVEAVTERLREGGRVFLQSDVEGVALRMRDLFVKYGKQSFRSVERLDHNPFGVRSDWELHVLAKGNPMYRFILTRTANYYSQYT